MKETLQGKETRHGFAFQLKCTLGHEFMLLVERESDLEESEVSTYNERNQPVGFVIYRDRTFVECGYCKAFCYLTGVKAEVEVDYTPPTVQ